MIIYHQLSHYFRYILRYNSRRNCFRIWVDLSAQTSLTSYSVLLLLKSCLIDSNFIDLISICITTRSYFINLISICITTCALETNAKSVLLLEPKNYRFIVNYLITRERMTQRWDQWPALQIERRWSVQYLISIFSFDAQDYNSKNNSWLLSQQIYRFMNWKQCWPNRP
jgi:hypothetical protein